MRQYTLFWPSWLALVVFLSSPAKSVEQTLCSEVDTECVCATANLDVSPWFSAGCDFPKQSHTCCPVMEEMIQHLCAEIYFPTTFSRFPEVVEVVDDVLSTCGLEVGTGRIPGGECGNGIIEGSEWCDDGNILLSDGCSDACWVEPSFVCNTESPSTCVQCEAYCYELGRYECSLESPACGGCLPGFVENGGQCLPVEFTYYIRVDNADDTLGDAASCDVFRLSEGSLTLANLDDSDESVVATEAARRYRRLLSSHFDSGEGSNSRRSRNSSDDGWSRSSSWESRLPGGASLSSTSIAQLRDFTGWGVQEVRGEYMFYTTPGFGSASSAHLSQANYATPAVMDHSGHYPEGHSHNWREGYRNQRFSARLSGEEYRAKVEVMTEEAAETPWNERSFGGDLSSWQHAHMAATSRRTLGVGQCTLRRALELAQNANITETVFIDLAVEKYTLTSSLPNVVRHTIIASSLEEKTVISGNHTTGILIVAFAASVTLNNLVLRDGRSTVGPALVNMGSVQLLDVDFIGNGFPDVGEEGEFICQGTAVWSVGILVGQRVSFTQHSLLQRPSTCMASAWHPYVVVSSGWFALHNTTASDNEVWGTIIATSSRVRTSILSSFVCERNSSPTAAACVVNEGLLSVSQSRFVDNAGSRAGSIANAGVSVVRFSYFEDNTGSEGAGAVLNAGALSVSSSSFIGNHVLDVVSSEGWGGAILSSAWIEVDHCVFNGNFGGTRGGAMYAGGLTEVSNTTFTNNSAFFGGGLFNMGEMTLNQVSFANNVGVLSGNDILSPFQLVVRDSVIPFSADLDVAACADKVDSSSGTPCGYNAVCSDLTGDSTILQGVHCACRDGDEGDPLVSCRHAPDLFVLPFTPLTTVVVKTDITASTFVEKESFVLVFDGSVEAGSVVEWSVNTTTMPKWMRLSPMSGSFENDLAGCTVTENNTISVYFTADGMVAGLYEAVVRIDHSGVSGFLEVEVYMVVQTSAVPEHSWLYYVQADNSLLRADQITSPISVPRFSTVEIVLEQFDVQGLQLRTADHVFGAIILVYSDHCNNATIVNRQFLGNASVLLTVDVPDCDFTFAVYFDSMEAPAQFPIDFHIDCEYRTPDDLACTTPASDPLLLSPTLMLGFVGAGVVVLGLAVLSLRKKTSTIQLFLDQWVKEATLVIMGIFGELLDLLSDIVSFFAIYEDEQLEKYFYPYAVCVGLACVVSSVSISLSVYVVYGIFVSEARNRATPVQDGASKTSLMLGETPGGMTPTATEPPTLTTPALPLSPTSPTTTTPYPVSPAPDTAEDNNARGPFLPKSPRLAPAAGGTASACLASPRVRADTQERRRTLGRRLSGLCKRERGSAGLGLSPTSASTSPGLKSDDILGASPTRAPGGVCETSKTNPQEYCAGETTQSASTGSQDESPKPQALARWRAAAKVAPVKEQSGGHKRTRPAVLASVASAFGVNHARNMSTAKIEELSYLAQNEEEVNIAVQEIRRRSIRQLMKLLVMILEDIPMLILNVLIMAKWLRDGTGEENNNLSGVGEFASEVIVLSNVFTCIMMGLKLTSVKELKALVRQQKQLQNRKREILRTRDALKGVKKDDSPNEKRKKKPRISLLRRSTGLGLDEDDSAPPPAAETGDPSDDLQRLKRHGHLPPLSASKHKHALMDGSQGSSILQLVSQLSQHNPNRDLGELSSPIVLPRFPPSDPLQAPTDTPLLGATPQVEFTPSRCEARGSGSDDKTTTVGRGYAALLKSMGNGPADQAGSTGVYGGDLGFGGSEKHFVPTGVLPSGCVTDVSLRGDTASDVTRVRGQHNGVAPGEQLVAPVCATSASFFASPAVSWRTELGFRQGTILAEGEEEVTLIHAFVPEDTPDSPQSAQRPHHRSGDKNYEKAKSKQSASMPRTDKPTLRAEPSLGIE
eukprot:Rmarinus@m.29951